MKVKPSLRFLILMLILSAVCQVNALAQQKDETNKNVDQTAFALDNNEHTNVDLSLWFAPAPAISRVDSLKNSNSDSSQAPFSTLFKYNTSPSDPEHRCYEITKSISKEYTFLFNFMSQSKFTNGRRLFIR